MKTLLWVVLIGVTAGAWADAPETDRFRVGGEARIRWEVWENFGFDRQQDDHFPLLRLRVHLETRVSDQVHVFLEGKSAWVGDRDLPGGRRPLDMDTLALQNAYLDIWLADNPSAAKIRLGRQELSYGAQRLISPLDWANARRTFDGARGDLQWAPWNISVFAVRPVIVEKYRFNESDSDQIFGGVYATRKPAESSLTLDTYLLRLDRSDTERYTAGTRLAGRCPMSSVDFDVEGGYQFGDEGERDIRAWFVAAQLGYLFNDAIATPRVYAGYDYASGDKNPDDNKVGTFDQLFPLGHAYLGYIDVLGRRNVQAYSIGMTAKPAAAWLVRVDGHYFLQAERADAVYNVGGGVLRAADPAASRELGIELDLTVTWRMNPATTFMVGYSCFRAGDFFRETGLHSTIHFAYASTQWSF